MMTKTLSTIALSSLAMNAYANQCETVRFADVGWTDITATTAVTSELLKITPKQICYLSL
jgi:glycine betaine/proline transport system substrate-binding protein